MKNKKLITMILGLLIGVGLVTSGVLAWLTATDQTPDQTFTVGKIVYKWSGSTVSGTVVPGQDLIPTKFSLTNTSNIKSEVRGTLFVTIDQDVIYH